MIYDLQKQTFGNILAPRFHAPCAELQSLQPSGLEWAFITLVGCLDTSRGTKISPTITLKFK